jgi:hypothetical protein
MDRIEEPRIGQVWASNDRRDYEAGRCQRLRVEAVVEGRARLLNLDTGRLTTVAVRRMRPNSSGYRLLDSQP